MYQALFQIGVFLFLIGIGLLVGTYRERQHFRNLQRREAQNSDFLISQVKSFPARCASESPPRLVVGEAVIATDYLKSFLAKIRNLFGGEVASYQSLMTRARREATQRIVEKARRHGYNAICNLRLETADIGGNTAGRRVATVAILASATAYHAHAST